MRELDLQHRYEMHLQDLDHQHLLGQLPPSRCRLRMARILHLIADLMEGKACVQVVYAEPFKTC